MGLTSQLKWSHPSVLSLLSEAPEGDPYEEIVRRARGVVLNALDDGWRGPPFDPFDLAERMAVETVPREDVDDARLVSQAGDRSRIEFNPRRRPARVRFSVAHELAHLLFSDHRDRVRYRNESHDVHGRNDDWQLEVLCNVAAAELLMPAGSFPISASADLSLPHLLDLRATYGVSTEALLRRVVKLTERAASLFAAARLADGSFRLDYQVGSRAWHPSSPSGVSLSAETVLSQCTAVGFSTDATERWPGSDDLLEVQAVGVPPYPGDRFPRVVGLLQPVDHESSLGRGIRYLRGDATRPQGDGPKIIAHVVNNTARHWGGLGFARALGNHIPAAASAYATWASTSDELTLGAIHADEVFPQVWVASLVAQAGYGDQPTRRPRLRLGALRECLETLAQFARRRDASVHVPLIGTGQGATPWPVVRDLLLSELCERDVSVSVYVLPDQPMPDELLPTEQLTLV